MLSPPIAFTNQSTRATYLRQVVQGYDAIIINEAFDNTARGILTDSLSLEYPYKTPVVDESGSTEDGGVLIYSRWPINYHEMMVYNDCDGSDCLAAKGAIYAQINKLGKTYHLFGTHLQAWADPQNIATRQLQLQQFYTFMENQLIPTDEPVIFGGDFNVEKVANLQNEYNQMLTLLNVEEPDYLGHNFTYDYLMSSYADAPFQEYLDYVFYEKNHLVPTVQTNEILILRSIEDDLWNIFDFSDHLAIRGRFEFLENSCPPDLVLENMHFNESNLFQAANSIVSTASISGNSVIQYQAGNCIEMQANFSVELGTTFEVNIQTCTTP